MRRHEMKDLHGVHLWRKKETEGMKEIRRR